jgi:regulator of RNase E activity RraA
MNDIKAQVKALLETAAKYKFTVHAGSDTVIRISRKFEPGDRSVFVECDDKLFIGGDYVHSSY